MKVLVACEESQAVCKAFRAKGHEAYSCDIVECSGGHPEWHIQGDVLDILNPRQISSMFYGIVFRTADGEAHKIEGKWDLIIAHPPCTYFSRAGANWLYRGGVPDVIWASPDCTTYSVAAISKHRRKEANGNLIPITDYAKRCDEINSHLIDLIKELAPRYFFIENPVGGLRMMNFMQEIPRYTVTYCQYGERRQKPTDIWTNHPAPNFKPPCKRGMPCHEAAPRGARTGTQALKNRIEKAKIPVKLCEHIVDICSVPLCYQNRESDEECMN